MLARIVMINHLEFAEIKNLQGVITLCNYKILKFSTNHLK